MKVPFPLSPFCDSSGAPLANGYLLVHLSNDTVSPSGAVGRNNVRVGLDATGSVASTLTVWPNSQLTPSTTVYIVEAYSASGQMVAGPIYLTVAALLQLGFGEAFGESFGS